MRDLKLTEILTPEIQKEMMEELRNIHDVNYYEEQIKAIKGTDAYKKAMKCMDQIIDCMNILAENHIILPPEEDIVDTRYPELVFFKPQIINGLPDSYIEYIYQTDFTVKIGKGYMLFGYDFHDDSVTLIDNKRRQYMMTKDFVNHKYASITHSFWVCVYNLLKWYDSVKENLEDSNDVEIDLEVEKNEIFQRLIKNVATDDPDVLARIFDMDDDRISRKDDKSNE